MQKLNWDKYFMLLAHDVAIRSNCVRRQVGALIVKDRHIIATGYNGTPRGLKNCNEGGCPRCNSDAPSGTALDECLCCHAEENAIVQAAYHGVSINGASIYTTLSPCIHCAKMIINAGIREVFHDALYTVDEPSFRILSEAGVTIKRIMLGDEE